MKKSHSLLLFILLVAIGIAGRLLPHAWNTTPMTAILLFGAVYLGWKYSFTILFSVMAVTDLVLGFYQWQMMLAVYASFAAIGLCGLWLRQHRGVVPAVIVALGSSVIFFLITNWAVWQFGTMYEHTLAGLLQSYTMALPFFRNMLVGDFLYTAGLFAVPYVSALTKFNFIHTIRNELVRVAPVVPANPDDLYS